MENFIAMTGILAKDPETNTTPKGFEYTRARMAHSQGYWDKQSNQWVEAKTSAAWYTLYANNTAGRQLQQLHKGDHVLVTGTLDMNQWTDKNGANRTEMVIHVKTLAREPSSKQGDTGYQTQGGYQAASNYQSPASPSFQAPAQSQPWETYSEPEF